MSRQTVLAHQFVEHIPDSLQEGTIYVSFTYATAVHKCCCGCGNEVVTPLSPTDWRLIFDGETISLHPSIGNWSLPCQSHYWITRNRVRWARVWTPDEIEAGRAQDAWAKETYFNGTVPSYLQDTTPDVSQPGNARSQGRIWQWLTKRIGSILPGHKRERH